MRVAKIVVPPEAVRAGRDAMAGSFTTQDVVDAVRSINEEVGLDVGSHSSEEYAALVAEKLLEKALSDGIVWPKDGGWLA